ncbi:TPA: undecaprenyl-phosphate glucose phosphotransferase, partial [Klebsiella pneumoniae]
MTILKHKTKSRTNASIISMIQRFSDITIIFLGLYICSIDSKFTSFNQYVVSVLIALVLFQMIGGITDFYRSWRGVKITFELRLVLQNWTLSFIFAIGLLTVIADFNFGFSIYL